MNAEALKARIRNIAKEKDIEPQVLMQLYFMDQFLLRLSLYKDKDSIIIKGGMLMVALLGISTRSTIDIDTAIKNYELNQESALRMFEDIVNIPYDDGCTFRFRKIEQIRNDNDYQGYRIYFDGCKEKINQSLHLDLSTGDRITPKEMDLTYKTFLLDEVVKVKSYNLETVVAEKMETVQSRGTATTRMKDYYDLYMIDKLMLERLDSKVLKEAFMNTITNRETVFIKELNLEILTDIRESQVLNGYWNDYAKSYSFAKYINFNQCIDAVARITEIVM